MTFDDYSREDRETMVLDSFPFTKLENYIDQFSDDELHDAFWYKMLPKWWFKD